MNTETIAARPADLSADNRRHVIAAGAIGNMLEWYDFAIYGYFATAIGKTFFPREDPVAQLLAAFGIFAVGFLMRPLGGAAIGFIGDRFGRRAALTLSMAAMAIPTFLVGILPGSVVLGMMAPILLTLLRMIQGLSVGGEFTTSVIFMAERAPPGRRGLMASLACCGSTIGILLGSATGAGLGAVMSAAALEDWGWRIPFLMSVFLGGAGFLLRRHIPAVTPRPSEAGSPLLDTLRRHGRLLAWLACLSAFTAVAFYISFVYSVSWLQLADGIAPARALGINTLCMSMLPLVMIAAGWLSDRIGRKPLLLAGSAIGILGALPFFWLMLHANPAVVVLGQMGLVLAVGIFLAVQASTMVEVAPLAVRCTVISLGYNLTLGLIGGCSPLVATWLVNRTSNDLSPAVLIMGAAGISFVAALFYRETYKTTLEAG
jgi:MFS transporter, MHS family, proline/betaine transporter